MSVGLGKGGMATERFRPVLARDQHEAIPKANPKMSANQQNKTFQDCNDLSDCVELSSTSGLYLKPTARLSITVTLPQLKSGQSISNWEVMEKLRAAIRPE